MEEEQSKLNANGEKLASLDNEVGIGSEQNLEGSVNVSGTPSTPGAAKQETVEPVVVGEAPLVMTSSEKDGPEDDGTKQLMTVEPSDSNTSKDDMRQESQAPSTSSSIVNDVEQFIDNLLESNDEKPRIQSVSGSEPGNVSLGAQKSNEDDEAPSEVSPLVSPSGESMEVENEVKEEESPTNSNDNSGKQDDDDDDCQIIESPSSTKKFKLKQTLVHDWVQSPSQAYKDNPSFKYDLPSWVDKFKNLFDYVKLAPQKKSNTPVFIFRCRNCIGQKGQQGLHIRGAGNFLHHLFKNHKEQYKKFTETNPGFAPKKLKRKLC